ncbi:MAG: hypothetical protein NVSMB2_11730 [Chloroflexota bacterium]
MVWPGTFGLVANGYSSTLPDLFASVGFVQLAAGGVLGGLLGGVAIYVLLDGRPAQQPGPTRLSI